MISKKCGFDKEKVHNWAFAQASLSAIWSLEDHNGFSEMHIQNAELLNELVL